jgi:hypothetical protein
MTLDKIDFFKNELTYIRNPAIVEFAMRAIDSLPDYFFSIPASSTGKYHPVYALGEGGLMRHTKAAVRIAVELFRTELWSFTDEEKDLIIAGLLIHDGYKSGVIQERYTKTDHPNIVVRKMAANNDLTGILSDEQFEFLTENIATHMGRWVFDAKTNEEVLDKPKSIAQRFFHLCDYIASRRCLEFNFNVPIIREG